MAINSTTNRVVYAGNGTSATFSFQFEFFAQTDLKVYLYDTILGGITTQVLNTDYVVSGTPNPQGIYNSGANIVFNSSPVATSLVTISRDPSFVQNFVLQQNQLIPSIALTNQLDYLTLLLQKLDDRSSRSVRLLDGMGSSFNPLLPSTVMINPGAFLAINGSSTGLALVPNQGLSGPIGFVFTGNGSSPATFQALVVSLSGSSVAGTLSLGNGGTGGLAPQEWGVVFASSATQLATTDPGGFGLPLLGQGSAAPRFSLLDLTKAVTGALPVPNGGTNATTANAGFNNLSPMTTPGDIIVAGSSGQALRLAAGTNGFVLTSTGPGTPPQWSAGGGGAGSGTLLIANNLSDVAAKNLAFNNIMPLTTQGDVLFAGSGVVGARLAAGNAGQVLTTQGVASPPTWTTIVSGSGALAIANNLSDLASKSAAFTNLTPTTTFGDVIYAGSANVMTRLAPGSAGNVLSTQGAGAAPSWVAVATGSSLTNPMNTTGDMIYGGAAGVATRLVGSVSNSSSVLVQTGSGGVSVAPVWTAVTPPVVVILNSSGTFVPPVGTLGMKVTVIGAGGGGGGVSSSAGASAAGGGGGGGGAAIKWFSGSSLLVSYPYVVASAPTGGTAGANNASAGSSTFFGALIALPGSAGNGAAATVSSVPTAGWASGGTASGGDVNTQGGPGGAGFTLATSAVSGAGGASILGGGGAGTTNGSLGSTAGIAGITPGSGGGGASQGNAGAAAAGGNGTKGLISIEIYSIL